ncbi:MAG: molybdopterin-dependent oxidoreductase [Dehalococcoidia bacterium]
MKFKIYAHRFTLSAFVIALLVASAFAIGCGGSSDSAYKDIDWQLTIIGDEEIVLEFQELLDMDACSGTSGFFTTVGIVNGPFDIKGVTLLDLCDLAGGVETTEFVRISAVDHYSMVFSYNQLHGEFITYNTSLREVENDGLTVAIIYEQDGAPLTEDCGRPLRVALIGDNVLTEGMYWVKWINKIEVLNFDE